MQTDRLSSLNHLFFHHVEQFRSDRLLTWQKPDGLEVYSTERFVREVLALSRFLSAGGLEGDRVGIFCENRPGWHIADFATLLARQVVVPVYPTLAPGQIQYLLRHSGCRVVVIGGQKQWEVLAPLLADLPQLRCVISLDELAAAHTSLPRIVSETPEWSPADREEIRARPFGRSPEPGDHRLHLRHHRCAEGRHAVARQFHLRSERVPQAHFVPNGLPGALRSSPAARV